MTTPVSTSYPVVRNAGDSGSFFASEHESPSSNPLIVQQVDPTAPQTQGLDLITNPLIPTANAQEYVKNFDPDLYDLRDTSHLMRFVRSMTGASGVGGIRRQSLITRLTSMLSSGAFLDLDNFYGAIFGLRRHTSELFPNNLDGTQINPYTDLANSDLWDDLMARDARYRSRLHQLARAVNMGATYPGIKTAAEALLSCDVDLVEAWVRVDMLANNSNLTAAGSGSTYLAMKSQYVTYGGIKGISYGQLQGSIFGNSALPAGNRGEVILTAHRTISQEERYQLAQVMNVLTPSNTQVTIASEIIEASIAVNPRGYSSDSENWQIQSSVTPALNLTQPATPLYTNAGPFSLARPVYSEYSGEDWTYNTNVVKATSYRLDSTQRVIGNDDENITYSDGTTHTYVGKDAMRDINQALSGRLSGEGVVTNMPFAEDRSNFATRTGV